MSWLFGSRAKDVGLEEQKMREEEQERDSFYHSGFTYNTEREFRNNYSAYAEEERENGPTTSNDLDSNALLSKILELFFVVLSTLGVLFTFPFSLFFSVKFVSSFEQLIVFRLGKARKIYGPGTVFVLPCIDNVAKIDMRVNSFEIPPLQIITADKGLVEMTTVVFSRVVDPMAAHCGLQDRDQTLRSLAYNIIYNQVVKKMLYDLTNPTYLSTLLEDCQKEINNFCKNLGVESTKISVTQMNVVKQGENQAMTLFNNLLKSDVGSQVMQHFTPHLKAYLDSNPGASSAATAAQNPLNSFEGTAQKQEAKSRPNRDEDLEKLILRIRKCCDDSLIGKVGRNYRIRCLDSRMGPVEFDIDLKNRGWCDWTRHSDSQHIDVTFTLQKDTLFNLVSGTVSPMSAYINGLVTIVGPMDAAVALKHLADRAKDCK